MMVVHETYFSKVLRSKKTHTHTHTHTHGILHPTMLKIIRRKMNQIFTLPNFYQNGDTCGVLAWVQYTVIMTH